MGSLILTPIFGIVTGTLVPGPDYCETVVSMVSMLSCSDQANAHRALLTMTNSPESCHALRKAGTYLSTTAPAVTIAVIL